jgi:outer membrane protein OmpA-like peptidoglycan-associated protein
MASLMVIFVLLFVAAVNNAKAWREKVRGDLIQMLRAKLQASGLDSSAIRQDRTDPYAIIVVMPQDLLFDKDSVRVKAAGLVYLQQVTPTIAGVLCEGRMRQSIQSVLVEGHTDTTYAGAGPGDSPDRGRTYNLRLSQGRSMSVVETSLAALQDTGEHRCYQQLVSASGRGQEEPLEGIPKDDERQRRVVFKIRVHGDLADELASAAANSATVRTER